MVTATRVAALLALAAVSFSYPTSADASRRSSLNGNLLIEDVTDIYLFPQLMQNYRNLIRIQMGATFAEGDGLFVFGNDSAVYGISLHRGDNVSPLGALQLPERGLTSVLRGASSVPGITVFTAPETLVDLMAGFDLGGASLGFRIGLANGGEGTEPDVGAITGKSQTAILLGIGYSVAGDFSLDLAFDASLGFGSEQPDANTTTSQFGANISLSARAYSKQDEQIRLGLLGAVGVNFDSSTTEVSNNDTSGSGFGMRLIAGLGPVYSIPKMNATVSAYALVGIEFDSSDANVDTNGNESSEFTLTIPAIQMAAELSLTEWLIFRAGAGYNWRYASETDTNDTTESDTGGDFGWSVGLGLVVEEFNLDLGIENNWVTEGPDFLGGDGKLLGSLTASYSF